MGWWNSTFFWHSSCRFRPLRPTYLWKGCWCYWITIATTLVEETISRSGTWTISKLTLFQWSSGAKNYEMVNVTMVHWLTVTSSSRFGNCYYYWAILNSYIFDPYCTRLAMVYLYRGWTFIYQLCGCSPRVGFWPYPNAKLHRESASLDTTPLFGMIEIKATSCHAYIAHIDLYTDFHRYTRIYINT